VCSCIIAGLLAWRDGYFSFIPWIILTIGLFIAHGTNNLLNDYTDYSRGVDKDYYFRTQYGVHPLVQGFWTKSQQIQWFLVSGVIATLAGFYALLYTGYNPVVISLFAFGALVLLFYTWPLKYWALGELDIFLIWGPIMVAGVYFVLAKGWTPNFWYVVLAGIPFGLSVTSINVGKHIDKRNDDLAKGVGTFPVRAGERFARFTNQVVLIMIYVVILYLVFIPHYFSPVMLIVFFAFKDALRAIKVLNKPRPAQPPQGYPAWPIWFAGVSFAHNRNLGGLFILGLILDSLLHVIPFTNQFLLHYWPMM
jgi:1,4-dihydroxy-2-naphthoate polyprenyltransferase